MAKFIGAVSLTAQKGYIEVVRSDAVEGGKVYDADTALDLAKDALAHAKRLKVKIKAFVPGVEPSEVSNKATLYAVDKLAKLEGKVPVIMKAKRLPVPYLAFLDPQASSSGSSKAKGLGDNDAKAKAAEPKGL